MPIRLMYVYLSIEKSAVGIELASRHESQEIRTIRGNAIALNTLYCCCCWWVLSSENLMMNWKFKLKRWYSLRVAVRPTENERCLGAPHTHTHTPQVSINCDILCTAFDLYFFLLRFVWIVVCQVVFCWCRLYFPSQSTNLKISPLPGSNRIE